MDTRKGSLEYLVQKLLDDDQDRNLGKENLWYAVRGSIKPTLLISNLAETLRVSAAQTKTLLKQHGFGDLVAQDELDKVEGLSQETQAAFAISSSDPPSPFPELFSIHFSPSLTEPIASSSQYEALTLLRNAINETAHHDPFAALYRQNALAYHDNFVSTDGKLIEGYIATHFREAYPRYVVNSGIGANEQFNHLVAHLNNENPNRKVKWLITDSPRHLLRLPSDATIANTLFMEFSRSGKTEETVKIHEYTPRNAKRIVFANSGPLRQIGIRDNNLVLDLPDEVSGRFGRNKTPILLAPMLVAKMPTRLFWEHIEDAIRGFDLSAEDCLPLAIGTFIYVLQQQRGVNHIYLGCNDDVIRFSADELLQFWNEGVNKDGNDISMAAYFGLLRDSHATIEGMLGNNRTKMSLFLLASPEGTRELHPMVHRDIDPIDEAHKGLRFGEEEMILAEANYERFSELMPSVRFLIHGPLSLKHAAVLGQLWADTTFCYSKLKHVDPGSNPEVKSVRDRAAQLLAEEAKKARQHEHR